MREREHSLPRQDGRPKRGQAQKRPLSEREMLLQERFLALPDFDAWLSQLQDFLLLPDTPAVFAHRMRLLESDGSLSHREKDARLGAEKRRITRELRAQLSALCAQIRAEGFWDERALARFSRDIPVRLAADSSRQSAIALAIARDHGHGIRSCGRQGNLLEAAMPPSSYEQIAQMCFSWQCLQQAPREPLPGGGQEKHFLERTCRAAQMDALIAQLRLLTTDYRSLHAMRDGEAKALISSFSAELSARREEIWQRLIVEGKASGRWVSEQKALRIVSAHYPDVIYQYRPEWLHGQSLDLYLPSLRAGIEYQGQQHFRPVEYFGGEQGLADTLQRDLRKQMLCESHGVRLLYWNYTDPLEDQWFTDVLQPQLRGENAEKERKTDAGSGAPQT